MTAKNKGPEAPKDEPVKDDGAEAQAQPDPEVPLSPSGDMGIPR